MVNDAVTQIAEIVTHGGAVHLDELVGYLQLKWHGEEMFPNVSKAVFRQISSGENTDVLGKKKNVILLGLGGGQFDEHGDQQKTNECCASLVAKTLGLDKDFAWGKIVKAVKHTDRNVPTLTLDLSRIVASMQRQGYGLQAILSYVEVGIMTTLKDFREFARTDISKVKEVKLKIGQQEHFIAVAETDDLNVSKYMKFMGAAFVVAKNSSGHVVVLPGEGFRSETKDILRILRIWEQTKRNDRQEKDWRVLESESLISSLPFWFFNPDNGDILNGGTSRPDVPQTVLSLNEIIDAIKLSSGKEFEPKHGCGKTLFCNSTPRDKCPWYPLGLFRCRSIRKITYQQQ
jgi:hypothetical protein